MYDRKGAGVDPRQDFATFLRDQVRQAGLTTRDIAAAFQRAAQAEQASGKNPEHPISAMRCSKSTIDRLLKGQALPTPPVPFTSCFLAITSRAARLSAEEHQQRWNMARTLLKAIAERPAEPRSATPTHPPEASVAQVETVARLRLEVDLQSARNTEFQLRCALRDAQFLVTTMWQITSTLREAISRHDVSASLAHRAPDDAEQLNRLQEESRLAIFHKQTAEQEAELAAARVARLEVLWEQARSNVCRLMLNPNIAQSAAAGPPESATSVSAPLLPSDLLEQGALDDIAGALRTAQAINRRDDALTAILNSAGALEPGDALAVLLAATKLPDAEPRISALASLLSNWPEQPSTHEALLRLTWDTDAEVRAAAAKGLVEIWRRDETIRDELVRLTRDEHAAVRAAAVEGIAAAWQGDESGFAAILQVAGDEQDALVRTAITEGLAAGWPGDVRARDVVLRWVDADQPDVAATVAAAIARSLGLGWAGDARARAGLLNLAASRIPEVTIPALASLARGWAGDEKAFAAFFMLSADFYEPVAVAAVEGLATGWAGDPKARGAVLRAARRPEIPVRGTAARSLAAGWPGDRTARDALALLANDKTSYVRVLVVQSLAAGWADDTAARDIVLRLVAPADGSVQVTVGAVESLAQGWNGDAEAHAVLSTLVHSRIDSVRAAAKSALARWTRS
ncbi:HEAT repeat domain-containing protein [Streptomyces sp. NPDC047737]|uniref:HEAT repeat domain-containing protein n=1 Tax=unclassified Streptomyces TaxID=2593676 RepID=UPI0033C4DD1B